MHASGQLSSGGSSKDGYGRRGKSRRYFTVYEDQIILLDFGMKQGAGGVSTTQIVVDLSPKLDREPESIKERFKKLSALPADQRKTIQTFGQGGELNDLVDFNPEIVDARKYYVHFDKMNGRKVLTINTMLPSLFNTLKVSKGEDKNIANDEARVDAYLAHEKPEPVETKSQYQKTINLTLEEKLNMDKQKLVTLIQPPKGLFNNSQVENMLNQGTFLGKRDSTDSKPASYTTTPCKVKQDVELNPKFDPVNNVIVTPNTKEEVEAADKFYKVMLENLAKHHGMTSDEVLDFAVTLPQEKFSFEYINKKLTRRKEKQAQELQAGLKIEPIR